MDRKWPFCGHFSSLLSLFGHSHGCCDHNSAHFRDRLHQKTSQAYGMMVWDHFCTFEPYSLGWMGSKMANFWGENQVTMAGYFQGREPTWKPFYVPYHLPIHGTAWLWAIFDHPSHISMAGGGQKWLIFRSKSGRNGRLVPGQGTNLETVLCAISPPNT